MFLDMGGVSESEADLIFRASVPWLKQMLEERSYVGWLALYDEQVVAGGGIQIRSLGPMPGCCGGGKWGLIANIYTAPAHRRGGLARSITAMILSWATSAKLNRVTLSASDEGRPLYKALGFIPTADMQLL